jgi:deoxyribodipyrimidine photolyase
MRLTNKLINRYSTKMDFISTWVDTIQKLHKLSIKTEWLSQVASNSLQGPRMNGVAS